MVEGDTRIVLRVFAIDFVAHIVMARDVEERADGIEEDADGGSSATAGLADDLRARVLGHAREAIAAREGVGAGEEVEIEFAFVGVAIRTEFAIAIEVDLVMVFAGDAVMDVLDHIGRVVREESGKIRHRRDFAAAVGGQVDDDVLDDFLLSVEDVEDLEGLAEAVGRGEDELAPGLDVVVRLVDGITLGEELAHVADFLVAIEEAVEGDDGGFLVGGELDALIVIGFVGILAFGVELLGHIHLGIHVFLARLGKIRQTLAAPRHLGVLGDLVHVVDGDIGREVQESGMAIVDVADEFGEGFRIDGGLIGL